MRDNEDDKEEEEGVEGSDAYFCRMNESGEPPAVAMCPMCVFAGADEIYLTLPFLRTLARKRQRSRLTVSVSVRVYASKGQSLPACCSFPLLRPAEAKKEIISKEKQ